MYAYVIVNIISVWQNKKLKKKRWRHEYLTSLREFHKTTAINKQSIKKGEVVLVHDDTHRST